MSCGCTPTIEVAGAMRARAGACVLCNGPDAPNCHQSGQPVLMHVKGLPCPLGKHPGTDGHMRWFVRWRGLAWFQRAWLWTRYFNDQPWADFKAKFPGCGCSHRLKSLAERVTA